MRRALVPLAALLAALAAAPAERVAADGGAQPAPEAPEAPQPAEPLLADDFERLDATRWEPLRVHDAAADRIEVERGWLVLAVDTLGTDDATVKLRGVRSRRTFEVPQEGPPLRIELTLDWNDQRNGCYLTAGFALVPAASEERRTGESRDTDEPESEASRAPHDLPEALAFELVGVPPGRNARPLLWRRQASALRLLYTEGWPQPRREDRTGRKVGKVRLALEVVGERVRLVEDGQERFAGRGALSGRVHLLLFVSSHSNYGERSVRFSGLRVTRD